MSFKSLTESKKNRINTIYDASEYSCLEEAFDALENLSKDRSMPEAVKELFNHNFYGFVKDIEQSHDASGLFKYVAKGIAYLAGLSADEKDSIYLKGDDNKHSLALIDTEGKYPSTFNASTGKCRFPSHWFVLANVVLVNELGDK